ncbi:MAG TPA: YlbF family regulator [Longimicrobiaceae bacterium]|nr:YlbF family regulator [Longimicrobiaceae bacterium]
MDAMWERAREVGRLLAQTDEYKALKRANDRLSDDREAVTRMNRLAELQDELALSLHRGAEPSQELQDEYERLVGEIQGNSVYQGLVAAQSNFDRVMTRINEEIARGIEAGAQSRIILPS